MKTEQLIEREKLNVEQEYNVYRQMDGVNFSLLKCYLDSPSHYKYEYDKYKQSTEVTDKSEFVIGKAIHTFVLQRDIFETSFMKLDLSKKPFPDKDFRNGDNKRWMQDEKLNAATLNKIILTDIEYDMVMQMGSNLLSNKVANKILQNATMEKPMSWIDEESGVLCKGIADMDWKERGMVVDLKSCADASKSGFRKMLNLHKYYMQLPMYGDGLLANDGIVRDSFYFICVEKTPPYHVAVYELDEFAKEIGRRTYKALLKVHKECVEKNEWKGYESLSGNEYGITPIGMTDYELNVIENHPLLTNKF